MFIMQIALNVDTLVQNIELEPELKNIYIYLFQYGVCHSFIHFLLNRQEQTGLQWPTAVCSCLGSV